MKHEVDEASSTGSKEDDALLPDNIKPLTSCTKWGYGYGDTIPATVTSITGFYLNAFLLEVADVPAKFAGTLLLVSKIWDAFSDPLVGILSDRLSVEVHISSQSERFDTEHGHD